MNLAPPARKLAPWSPLSGGEGFVTRVHLIMFANKYSKSCNNKNIT